MQNEFVKSEPVSVNTKNYGPFCLGFGRKMGSQNMFLSRNGFRMAKKIQKHQISPKYFYHIVITNIEEPGSLTLIHYGVPGNQKRRD